MSTNHEEDTLRSCNKCYLFYLQSKQPKIIVSDEDDVKTKDTTRSVGDNISKSDTQDDISDKIFDNLSMHR